MKTIENGIRKFTSRNGAEIYQLPLQAFPGFWVYAYLVFMEEYKVLIDTGSGFGSSNDDLESAFQMINQMADRTMNLSDLTHVLITHAHIDHFGGLEFIKEHSDALLGVHELDKGIITNFEERLTTASRKLEAFLIEAGVEGEHRQNLLEMYMFPKALFHPVCIDFTYETLGMALGPFEFFHVPGHSAGHVVIRLHDVLFSGDHILDGISPHQAPEYLTLSTGLDHYFHSLDAVAGWAVDINVILPGHKMTISNIQERVRQIKEIHRDRLERVIEILDEPKTIVEISRMLFNKVSGYNVLLALEETGAHVEYLYQRGQLRIDNLSEYSNNGKTTAIRYRRSKIKDRVNNKTGISGDC